MKKFLFVLALTLCATVSHAQATPPTGTPHQVNLSWTAPSPVGGSGTIAGYYVYRSISGAAFAKLFSTTITALSYSDVAVASGQVPSYCASTLDSKNAESACSVVVSVTVPSNPNPPTLSISSVAMNVTGGVETIVARWNDTNLVGESFFFSDGTRILNQGLTSSANGAFAELFTGPSGVPIYFTVCNSAGQCASQQAM